MCKPSKGKSHYKKEGKPKEHEIFTCDSLYQLVYSFNIITEHRDKDQKTVILMNIIHSEKHTAKADLLI